MTDKRKLGIYWGDSSFYFVEVDKGKILKSMSVPFSTTIDAYQSQDIPEGLRFTTLIQKALSELKITSKKVNLSLPAKDIIFRSFVIPWMEEEEVKNVVDFEAIKYIPIKLEELSYTYHPITITENNQKNIRIIFVAARKDTLQKYTSVLEHTGLSVDWVEPSPMSLVRVLEQKAHIPRHHGCAVVQIDALAGKIIFVDHDAVQFVREFQLSVWNPQNAGDLENFSSRLFNEIRVSLNFYSRQNPHGKITRVILLSAHDLPNFDKTITESMNLQASLLTVSTILKSTSAHESGLLNAYGIALRDKKSAFNNFNLLPKTGLQQSAGSSTNENKYKLAAIAVVVAIALVALVSSVTKNMLVKYKQQLTKLKAQETPFESSSKEDIEKLDKEIADKLVSYKDIQMESQVAFYLSRLPQVLPEGTWFRDWEISYITRKIMPDEQMQTIERSVSNISIMLDGYAYTKNTNEQFRLVNNLVTKLKNEKDIAAAFKDIDLVTVRQETLNENPVTYFRINLK